MYKHHCTHILRTLVVLIVLTLMVGFYLSTKPAPLWYTLPAPCRLEDSVLDDMNTLALQMHKVLKDLHVPHAACYGTLWGIIRLGGPLPWDTNVDLCAMDDHLRNVTFRQLAEAFQSRGLQLTYDWKTAAYTVLSPPPRSLKGHLSIFTKIVTPEGEKFAVPGGWAKALWRLFGQRQLSFPAWLLEAPFREEGFIQGGTIPVPHDGIEMLKYLYPQDWWLEVKPPGCS